MTTQLSHPPLPAGADNAEPFEDEYGEPDPNGRRFVRGPSHPVPGASVFACCFQRVDGSIITMPKSAPCVAIYKKVDDLTPAEARDMARKLMSAAELAESWANP